jgi:hypothetical protein
LEQVLLVSVFIQRILCTNLSSGASTVGLFEAAVLSDRLTMPLQPKEKYEYDLPDCNVMRDSNVSEEHIASIFRIEEQTK